jgi:hypothetical protein
VGTQAEAEAQGWVSMAEGVGRFGEEEWLERMMRLTTFTLKEWQECDYKPREMWEVFEKKIRGPAKVLTVKDIFEKYVEHLLLKLIANGYQRVEVRSSYALLQLYDQQGSRLGQLDYAGYAATFQAVYDSVTAQHPHFSLGWIYSGYKFLEDHENLRRFREVCTINAPVLVGFDFVNEEDQFESLERYDTIVEQIFREFPHLSHLKKAYHAGETTCHRSDNIEVAVKGGAARLGHGLNVLQRIDFLPHCRHVCFEKNPLSNLILGYQNDLRESSAPVLLGLGYPVSISPDDPGKFGLEDSTEDYFVAAIAYDWSLRHLKLIAYHSINHALCEEPLRTQMLRRFDTQWDRWVCGLLSKQGLSSVPASLKMKEESEMFEAHLGWSFSTAEEAADARFKAEEATTFDALSGMALPGISYCSQLK